jgi:hypothetical protein
MALNFFVFCSNAKCCWFTTSDFKGKTKVLNTQALRAYTNDDVIGVEVGGSVKNVLAIAAGIAAGLDYGASAHHEDYIIIYIVSYKLSW